MTDLSRLIIIIDSGNDPPAPAGQHRHIGSIHTMDENKMEYGADLLTLLDEDGNEHQFEVADTMEYEGEEYMALVPVFDDPEDLLEDSGELLIFRSVNEDGDGYLEPIEDEALFHTIADLFMERLEDEYDFIEE